MVGAWGGDRGDCPGVAARPITWEFLLLPLLSSPEAVEAFATVHVGIPTSVHGSLARGTVVVRAVRESAGCRAGCVLAGTGRPVPVACG